MAVVDLWSVFLLASACSLASSDPSQPVESENSDLKRQVLQLEQTLTSLQAHSQTQDQKYAAILSSVLSTITALRNEHNSTLNELTAVKAELATVKVELKTTQSKLNGSISEITSLKQQLKTLNEHNCTLNEFTAVKDELATVKDVLKTTQSQLNVSISDITSLKHQFSTTKRNITIEQTLPDIQQTEVSFEALRKRTGIAKNSQRSVFDVVIVNEGHAYNSTTGTFTAPVPGTYMFWAYIQCNVTTAVDITNSKGFLVRAYARSTNKVEYIPAAPTIVAVLQKGEDVWVQLKANVSISGNYHSSFGGTLLHRH